MARIIQYVVTYKHSTQEPQQEEIFYTPEAARSKMASVELWGGIAIMSEQDIDEEDVNGIR